MSHLKNIRASLIAKNEAEQRHILSRNTIYGWASGQRTALVHSTLSRSSGVNITTICAFPCRLFRPASLLRLKSLPYQVALIVKSAENLPPVITYTVNTPYNEVILFKFSPYPKCSTIPDANHQPFNGVPYTAKYPSLLCHSKGPYCMSARSFSPYCNHHVLFLYSRIRFV